MAAAYENLQFHLACEEILKLLRANNKFIDDSAPWKAFKQGEQQEVELVLYSALESVRLSAYLLAPVIPNLSSDIYGQLGFDLDFNNHNTVNKFNLYKQHSQWGAIPANQNLTKAKPIFARLELSAE